MWEIMEENIFKNEDGDYQDKAGNLYTKERVNRYHVYSKWTGSSARPDEPWSLVYSCDTLESAKRLKEEEEKNDVKKGNDHLIKYKVKDAGKPSYYYSLLW